MHTTKTYGNIFKVTLALLICAGGIFVAGCSGNSGNNPGLLEQMVDVIEEAEKEAGNQTDIHDTDNDSESEQETQSTDSNPHILSGTAKVYTVAIDETHGYGEGLIAVSDVETGMWGYINKKGEYIIEPQYYDAYPFSEGLAAVQMSDGYYNFINTDNEVVIDLDIIQLKTHVDGDYNAFHKGYALVSLSNENAKIFSLIDKQGNIIKDVDTSDFYDISVHGNVRHRRGILYDAQYKEIPLQCELPAGCELDSSRAYSERHYSSYVSFWDKNSDFSVLVNEYGEIMFDFKIIRDNYDLGSTSFTQYTDDYIFVQRDINGIKTSALFDYNGNMLIDFEYKQILPINKDSVLVYNQADKSAILDVNGNELVPFSSERITSYNKIDDYRFIQNNGGVIFYEVMDGGSINNYKFYNMHTNELIESPGTITVRDTTECVYSYVKDGMTNAAVFRDIIYDLDGNVLFDPDREFYDKDFETYDKNYIFFYHKEGSNYLAMVVNE